MSVEHPLIDTEWLKQLDRFSILLKKKVNSIFVGQRSAHNAKGQGTTFTDYRQYFPGDDLRNIDWKIYARTEEYFVKQFEEERNLTIHCIIDASASMNFGKPRKKFHYGGMIATGLAYMALKNNERFEVSTFADDLNIFRPAKGINHLIQIVDHLSTKKLEGKSNFLESMMQYKSAINTRSLIVIISDFLFDPSELNEALFLFHKSEVLVVQVLDGSERKISFSGDLILEDSETKSKLRTFISNRLLRSYEEKLQLHIDALKKVCDDHAAKFISVSNNAPIFETFYEIIRQ
ncbi:DUF58 domain-containing protein [Candidatus Woesearchaeota archaeon]|nr:MAG: DUF58 domain-containing protein [Candidatus Woesearchaeota archaeon]